MGIYIGEFHCNLPIASYANMRRMKEENLSFVTLVRFCINSAARDMVAREAWFALRILKVDEKIDP